MNAIVCKAKNVRLTHRLALLTLFLCVFSGVTAWGQDLPFTPTTDESNPILYWIETVGATGFYAVPHSNNSNASTTNAPTLRALWYFKASGEEGYYYIINDATGKYLKKTGNTGSDNTIGVADHVTTDDDKFKFSFGTPQGITEGSWVVYPKEAGTAGWLSKKSGSAQYDLWLKVANWNGTPVGDNNSQWNIVPRADVQWPKSGLPFQVSTSSSDRHYYRINHAQSTQYNLSYDGSDFVTISDADDRKKVWYFEQAATDSDINNLHYYKIVNALTGKCLKFTATTINGSNQNDVFKLADYDSNNTDPFLFVVVDSYGGNAGYSIMPKLAMSKFDVSNYANSMVPIEVGNNKRAALRRDRNNNNAHWNFIATEFVNTCDPPVITVTYDGNGEPTNVSISAEEDATIYYTTDGSNPVVPTTGSTTYTAPSNPYSFTPGSDVSVIRAVASINPNGSDVSGQAFEFIRYITVSSSDVIINNLNLGLNLGYRLAENFTSNATIGTAETPFRGAIDGDYHSFTLSHALIGVAQDAIIKNVVVSSATVSGSGNVGAIVNTAQGSTKIYNCGVQGGSVSGGTNTGGLVGLIEAGSSVRVVNCYNFADVIGGGTDTYAAGIVGMNNGTVSSDGSVGNVRIALCMMYGNVTNATSISPVYGGNHQDNIQKFTEYNYWRYRSGMQYTAYNDQMAIDKDDFLTRFPFYTHILNTHREMAAFFLFGGVTSSSVSSINENQIKEMGHWVLKKDEAPYPIIEPWQTNTKKVLDAPTPSNILTEMGGTGTNAGYLTITVKIGGHTYTQNDQGQPYKLPITDMDEENFDYTWGKVVLPFANEFEVNNDYSKICTGWKITNVDGETSFSIPSDEPYNFSDRNNKKKDIYDETNNPYIFAQGGNYIVPYGVTAITIEANFANAFYLRDATYDIAYSGDKILEPFGYTGRTGLAGSPTPSTYQGQPVYNTLLSALSASGMTASGTPHTQAVVLVGNFHMDAENLSSKTGNGFTIMSIDADNNQEPDYAIYSNNTLDRPAIPPTRFDFVAFIPLGMSSHVTNAKFYPNTPIWKPRGWFEITETGLLFANQFEIESDNFVESNESNYRCVINGGYFTQMVRSRANPCTKLKFYQIGGHAYVKEFYPGNHSAESKYNTLVPVNVTGGEIEQCFMTGYGKGRAYGPNIYFWCGGGKIHKFLGAYMEPPVQTNSHTGSNHGIVDLTAKIDHAIIVRFFGGGTTSNARITGDINVTIDNSKVDFYCGGPEFGDMETGKTVTTSATNTTFGEYYGAGFGGTAITYKNDVDDGNVNLQDILNYPSDYFTDNYVNNGRLHYLANYGLGNCYKFEFIMHSRGHRGVARFYRGYASFSLATTGSVTNNLDHCTVLGNFFGAGCQGKVSGTVTSTLTDCTLQGSAFGGGYKAAANEVDVYPTTMPALSVFKAETGIFSDFGTVAPETYQWMQGGEDGNPSNQADEENRIFYTSSDIKLNQLGNVTGKITLSVEGHTIVKGSVFGGGFESKSLSDTEVKILGQTKVLGNIYGGGNMGEVEGNTKVIVNSGNDSGGSGGGGN